MVQGGNLNKKKKQKKVAPKRKNAPSDNNTEQQGKDEMSRTVSKKVKQHQKKIYKSIEDTIISKAKNSRERFDIL
jgi:hypothetical protein